MKRSSFTCYVCCFAALACIPSSSSAAVSSTSMQSGSSTASASSSAASVSASSNAATIVDPIIADPDWTFPQPFDTILSTNFTSLSCPSFFTEILSSTEFIECRPFSLLLESSNAFFKAQQDPTTLPYVMNGTCNVPSHCSDTMSGLASRIQGSDACGADLKQGNALAAMALRGLKDYVMMQQAGCATNAGTGAYCFVEAAESGDPDKSYFYNLPSGTSLPSATTPDCSDPCTQNLMSIYATYAENTSLVISSMYDDAAALVNRDCGPTYAALADHTSADTSLFRQQYILTKWTFVLGSFVIYLGL